MNFVILMEVSNGYITSFINTKEETYDKEFNQLDN
jgi:hypothetical protein